MESHENFDHNVKRLVGNTGGDVEPSKHRQWVFLIVKCIPESPALSSQSILAARGTMLATRSNSSLNPCGRKGTIHPLKIGRSNHPVWRYFNKYEGASLMKMKKAVLNKGKTGQIKMPGALIILVSPTSDLLSWAEDGPECDPSSLGYDDDDDEILFRDKLCIRWKLWKASDRS